MKKSLKLIFTLFILALTVSLLPIMAFAETDDEGTEETETSTEVEPDEYGLTISAECAVLIDGDTHEILYERNADKQHLIASTTKIMTAIVVLEKCEDLDELHEIQPEWTGIEGSSMYLEAGEMVSVRGLLYGILLNSGNDAATAAACIVAGDEATFVDWMNEYAENYGMQNTHFTNPHGLDDDEHYSTAYDMALLMTYAMQNEDFREISHTRYKEIDGHELYFHNKLLNLYYYCMSGKTGYTMAAGRTLVTASVKDGKLLVAVTLNDYDDWNDQIEMYDYGYSFFHYESVCEENELYTILTDSDSGQGVPVFTTEALGYNCFNDETLDTVVYLPDEISGSIQKGAVIGRIIAYVGEKRVGTSYLVSGVYVTDSGEVSYEWKNDFKNSCLLAELFPDAQPNGSFRMEGLLLTE